MYKLLALDMDGTLLNNEKKISKKNIHAIKLAREKGVKVVLCTGRPIEGISSYLKTLSLIDDDEYSITSSGATIQNNTRNNIIIEHTLDVKQMHYLYNMSKDLDLNLCFLIKNIYFSTRKNLSTILEALCNNLPCEIYDLDNLSQFNNVAKVTLFNEDIAFLPNYEAFFGIDTNKYSHIEIKKSKNIDLFRFKENLPKELIENFTVLKTSNFSIEVISKNTNKGMAVENLCSYLNIPISEAICIGDSGNDEHMIKAAGFGVAMGNALNEIKTISDYITLSNEEDGVAHVIEKFIL